jgi:signal peptidase I
MHRRLTILFGTLVAALAFKSQPLEPVVVLGESMSPTFHPYQVALATRDAREIRRGEVVVFRKGDATLIKRVAALPGDRVTSYLDQNEWVLPSAGILERFYRRMSYPRRTVTISPGELFVVGDNRVASIDSRTFGPVPASTVWGKVLGAETSKPIPGVEAGPLEAVVAG